MVQTSNQIPITDRISNFLIWVWGLIYLFFATIFSDPKKMNVNSRGGSFGNGKGPKMHGMKKAGPKMGGG